MYLVTVRDLLVLITFLIFVLRYGPSIFIMSLNLFLKQLRFFASKNDMKIRGHFEMETVEGEWWRKDFNGRDIF